MLKKKPLMQIAYILGKLNTIYLPIDRRHVVILPTPL